MGTYHIALGSNVGNRRSHLVAALELIGRLPGTSVTRVSRFIDTLPVGGPFGQEHYLNAAAEIDTLIRPRLLFERLCEIELRLGRTRSESSGPRTIDLDLLLCGDERIHEADLEVPHPRMHFRRFVLEPLQEIAPDVRHPDGWTINDRWIELTRLPYYLAITGPVGCGRSTVAREFAWRLGAQLLQEPVDLAALTRSFGNDARQRATILERSLERHIQLLASRRTGDSGSKWLISDFWIAQSLAYASVLLPQAECAEFQSRVSEAVKGLVPATLVIRLDSTAQKTPDRAGPGNPNRDRPADDFLAGLELAYERVFATVPPSRQYQPRYTSVNEATEELLTVAQSISGEAIQSVTCLE